MEAYQNFLNCKQTTTQTVAEYRQQLTLWSDTIEHHGGSIVVNYRLASVTDVRSTIRTVDERKEAARQETLSMALLRGADRTRFGTLLDHLADQYAAGRDEYPKDLQSAYGLLAHYRSPSNTTNRTANGSGNNGNANNNSGNNNSRSNERREAPATDESATTLTQHGGGSATDPTQGSCSVDVPSAPATGGGTVVTSGTTLVQYAVMMAQAELATIDPTWILLDSQSTISVFNNMNMLHNIRRSPYVLRAITNGGFQDSNMVGDFPNLGEVWYNDASIANVLSLSDVTKVCTVTMDSSRSLSMDVQREDGSIMRFVEHPSGLYVYKGNESNDRVNSYTLLSTVAQHKQMFSPRQIQQADLARRLYRLLGRPDEKEFSSILRNNLINNCPITPDNAHQALVIYGTDVATLKGKMT